MGKYQRLDKKQNGETQTSVTFMATGELIVDIAVNGYGMCATR